MNGDFRDKVSSRYSTVGSYQAVLPLACKLIIDSEVYMVIWRSFVCIRNKPVVILGFMTIQQYCKAAHICLLFVHLKTLAPNWKLLFISLPFQFYG